MYPSELPLLKNRSLGFRSFLKTGVYSKLTLEYQNMHEFSLYAAANHTGRNSYYGAGEPYNGHISEVHPAMDQTEADTQLELNAGVQNSFNAFQKDFDTGSGRASSYIYGPGTPWTFFAGLKLIL
jgi:hypothetical protein